MVYARSCREKFEFYDRSNDENLSDLQTFWSQESIDLISYYYVAIVWNILSNHHYANKMQKGLHSEQECIFARDYFGWLTIFYQS